MRQIARSGMLTNWFFTEESICQYVNGVTGAENCPGLESGR
jgi:hypothetical protein